ncbi:hypothetical protein QEN19_002577 [Hanseniaspora menglaensis]
MSTSNSILTTTSKNLKPKRFVKMVSIGHIPELKEKHKADEIPMNDKGELISNEDDEFVLPIDEEGEKKVDINGDLLDGREYKFNTFTLKTRSNPNKKYVLASDMAKILDYTRGALLFINHKYTIFKCHLTDEEKEMLKNESNVLDNITSLNLHKAVLIVPARSLFREFGHKCIKGGVAYKDDYYTSTVPYPEYPESVSSVSNSKIYQYLQPYVKDPNVDVFPPKMIIESAATTISSYDSFTQPQIKRNRSQPQTPEVLAKLASTANNININKQTEQFYTRSSTNTHDQYDSISISPSNATGNTNTVTRSHVLYNPQVQYIREDSSKRVVDMFDMMQSNLNISLNAKMTKENWIFMHAEACSRLNYDLYENRERWQFVQNRGVRDPYTNGLHVPKFTQPTRILSKNKIIKNRKKNSSIGIDIEFFLKDDNLYKVKTGLNTLPGLEHMKQYIDDKEILDAIEQQVDYENNN